MKNSRVELDKRRTADIKEQIKKLSKIYVPEWHFDTNDPDIGSVIGMIFAEQMADNVSRFNELIDVYHAELANMTGVSLLPAQPASTTAVMKLSSDTVSGSYVPKGTKLFGGETDERLIFETAHPIYITNSHLTDILETSSNSGKVRSIMGHMQPIPLIPELSEGEDEAEEEIPLFDEDDAGSVIKPFVAFDGNGRVMGKNAIVLYHSYYFDINDENIYMRLESPDHLAERIVSGDYKITYLTDDGFKPFDEVGLVDENLIYLKKSTECKKITRDKDYSVIAIEAGEHVNERIGLKYIDFSSKGEKQPFRSVGTGNTDCNPTNFRPFTDKLSVFEECFMRHDEYFSRVGAKITVSFDVEFAINQVSMSVAQIEDSLKVIKRKPRLAINTRVVEAVVDEISIEYSSATGWKRLNLMSDESTMFASMQSGRRTFSFICPDDWVDESGRGRAIRFQIIKSDNCYMMPCNHNYPIIRNATVEYSYEGRFVKPDHIEVLSRTEREDVTSKLLSEKGIDVFRVSEYSDNALYFGFNRKFTAGPISMLMIFNEESSYLGTKLRFEYSTIDGFKTLQVVDKTDSFARTGQIRFLAPDDMAAVSIEGRKCYWIRVIDVNGQFSKKNVFKPEIKDIVLNAAEVRNIDTHEMEEFFVDEVSPGMVITLAANNILDVQVWVNEIGKHSKEEMKELIRDHSDKAYAEYDTYGNISDLFVKWDEVASFDRSHEGDRHYILDRQTGSIFFGDGVHVAIPTVTTSTAIRVIARSCNGSNANIPAYTIDGSMTHVDFLGEIYNPFPAYGGSSIESVESAVNRAANIIGSHNRIVTMADYKKDILSFSDNINKVECIIGESVDGSKRNGLISVILLMKDFGKETNSFDRVVPRLRKHLEECVELTAGVDSIEIVEPIGVAISVDIWMNRVGDETDYEIGLRLINELNNFLSPISDPMHPGWEIGKIPSKSQIMMKLNSLKTKAFIRRLVITGTYTDTEGTHECDIEKLPKNKFFVVKNGTHKVHAVSDEINF